MARPITARYIDRQLRQRGSPLAGQGQAFIDAGTKYDLDPLLLVAISGAESEYGKKVKRGTHNPFGWGPHIPFQSWGQAIDTVGGGLRRGYLDQGLTTPEEIGGKWAPIGAGNDPTNLNQNWAGNVNRLLTELGGSGGTAPGVRAPAPASFGAPSPPSTRQPAAAPPTDSGLLANIFQSGAEMIGVDPPDLGSLIPSRPAKPVAQAAGVPVVQDFRGKPSKNTADIVELAEHFLGTPYSWGGGGKSGPSEGFGRGAGTVGFDCSSFLQFLWSKQGVDIPRVTYDQWKVGKAVPRGKLQPGDGVYFRPGPQGPEHVGMFIGNGQFIHAPKTGDVVKISRLNDSYYRRNYMGARRFG